MRKNLLILMIGYIIGLIDININGIDILYDVIGYALIAYSFYHINQQTAIHLKTGYPVAMAVLAFIISFLNLSIENIMPVVFWLISVILHLLIVLDIFKLLHSRAEVLSYPYIAENINNIKKSYLIIFGISYIFSFFILMFPVGALGFITFVLGLIMLVFEIVIVFKINNIRTLEVLS